MQTVITNRSNNSLVSKFIIRIREFFFLARLLLSIQFHKWFETLNVKDSDVLFCENMLSKVSRSFSTLIRKLPDEKRECAGIFYLILRGLDTLEDDPTAFDNKEDRIDALKSFHTHMSDPTWYLKRIGEGHDRALLENFDSVIRRFLKLRVEYQEIIRDITRRMGDGMAEIIGLKLDGTQGTKTMEEYNKYCYYAAGLVGEGLQSLLDISEDYMDKSISTIRIRDVARGIGSLLQKTNIIRDFLEDYSDGRSFWPIPMWPAVDCLNELVVDALGSISHAPKCLAAVTNRNIIPFVAIPFLMALATLSKIYDNPNVFTGVVKICKGLAAYILYNSNDINPVLEESLRHIEEILNKTNQKDVSNRSKIQVIRNSIKEVIKGRSGIKDQTNDSFLYILSVGVVISALMFTVIFI